MPVAKHAGDREVVRTKDARSASTSLQAAGQARATAEADRLPVHVRALEHPLHRLRELVRRAECAALQITGQYPDRIASSFF
jgi:hypothetical protein